MFVEWWWRQAAAGGGVGCGEARTSRPTAFHTPTTTDDRDGQRATPCVVCALTCSVCVRIALVRVCVVSVSCVVGWSRSSPAGGFRWLVGPPCLASLRSAGSQPPITLRSERRGPFAHSPTGRCDREGNGRRKERQDSTGRRNRGATQVKHVDKYILSRFRSPISMIASVTADSNWPRCGL